MLGVMRGVVVVGVGTETETGEPGGERGAPVGRASSAGGGRSGEWRESRRQRLRADISWRRAVFSERELPSSERIASIRRSRSAMSPSSVVMYSFRLTLKFRALILFLSCLFSLLLIFLYSSGLGRQSSGSRILSGEESFEDFDFPVVEFKSFSEGGYDFLMPPEATAPRRERLGGACSCSGSESDSRSEWSFEVAGVPTSCGSIANMGVGGSMLSGLEPVALAPP